MCEYCSANPKPIYSNKFAAVEDGNALVVSYDKEAVAYIPIKYCPQCGESVFYFGDGEKEPEIKIKDVKEIEVARELKAYRCVKIFTFIAEVDGECHDMMYYFGTNVASVMAFVGDELCASKNKVLLERIDRLFFENYILTRGDEQDV